MSKPKDYEGAVEALTTEKEALKENKVALKDFRKEHKIKGDKQPEGAKLIKSYGKLTNRVDKGIAKVDELKALVKELKPGTVRQVKYDYPEGLDDKGKKKFRAAARRALKIAEKEAAKDDVKPKKKDKKDKKNKENTEEKVDDED